MARRRAVRVDPATVATNTAWAYCVVSSEGQSDTLPHQLAWCRDVAARQTWTITRELSDVSSGKYGSRDAYQKMLADIRALPTDKRPEWVLMIRLDRVGRGDNLAHVQVTLSDLYDLGCKVFTREDGAIPMDSAMSQLIAAIKLAVAQQENSVRTDKLMASYARRRQLRATDPTVSVTTRPPYGLLYDNGKLRAKEPEDAAVRRAYELRLQGYGFHRIGQFLANEAPPLSRKNGKSEYQKWNGDRVSRLIRQEMYRDVLVDAATWHRAQRNKRPLVQSSRRHEWPLGGGALRCECGTPLTGLTGNTNNGTGAKRFYYSCSDRRRAHGTKGKAKFVVHRKERIEEQFVALLGRLSASRELTARFAADSGTTDESERELRKRTVQLRTEVGALPGRRERLFAALEAGAMDNADFAQRLTQLKEREQRAQAELASAEAELAAERARVVSAAEAWQLVRATKAVWERASTDEQQAMARVLGAALGGITVDIEGRLSVSRNLKVSGGELSRSPLG